MAAPTIVIGAAACAYPGESVSGDAWRADWHDGRCRLAVIDGLGHGPTAAAAAYAAIAELAAHPALSPETVIRRCHDGLRYTRGAAMLVTEIDAGAGTLTLVGVGNVECRLSQGGRDERLLTDRGIVGCTLPTMHPVVRSLARPWLLLIHTDGVSNRFNFDAAAVDHGNVDEIAAAILGRWARLTDDATVVVAGAR